MKNVIMVALSAITLTAPVPAQPQSYLKNLNVFCRNSQDFQDRANIIGYWFELGQHKANNSSLGKFAAHMWVFVYDKYENAFDLYRNDVFFNERSRLFILDSLFCSYDIRRNTGSPFDRRFAAPVTMHVYKDQFEVKYLAQDLDYGEGD